MTGLERERYPIGRFERCRGPLDRATRSVLIDAIARAPSDIRRLVEHLTDAQLETRYRVDGWTIRQVVHHVPDSHMNAYIRFKLALTENEPTIKPYAEAQWAALPDSRTTPVETSLAMLDTLHERWMHVLRAMQPADFSRTLMHPENGVMTLDHLLAMYAWHGPHHTAHVTELRKRNGW